MASYYLSYGTETIGTSLKLGIPLREDLVDAAALFDLLAADPAAVDHGRLQQHQSGFHDQLSDADGHRQRGNGGSCLSRLFGCRSPPAIRRTASSRAPISARRSSVRPRYRCVMELAQGGYLTSLAGYGFTYNTLDNNKHPTNGIIVNFGQDFAGLGGDAAYIRTHRRLPQLLRNRLRSDRHRCICRAATCSA